MRVIFPLVMLLLVISTGVATADEFVPMVPVASNPILSGINPQTSGQYVPDVPRPYDLKEDRIFCPADATIDRGKLNLLAKRLFAEAWISRCVPVWGPLPWPSRVTQTYGACPEGESLLLVDAPHGQYRPGWTWWKDSMSGVHLEKCTPGNWVATTFVLEPAPRIENIMVPVPVPQCLPPLGELCIVPTEPIRLRPVNVTLCPVERVVVPCAPAPCQPPGSMVIGRGESRQEHTIGGIFFSSDRERERRREKKHEEEICPPDQHPPYEPAPEAPPEEPCPPDPCI